MVRLQDDFYEYVNGEWAETAVIPEDKPVTGGFMDLDQEIEKLMLDTTNGWLAGKAVPEDSVLQNYVKYHRMLADFEGREAAGVAPAMPWVQEMNALSSFKEFAEKIASFEMAGKPNLFPFSVAPDFKNAQMNVLWAEAPSLILPDTTYYAPVMKREPSYWQNGGKCKKSFFPNLAIRHRKPLIFWIA